MIDIATKFDSDGFVVVNDVLKAEELCFISKKCNSEIEADVGTRNLLQKKWVRELAQKLILHDSLKTLLPKNSVVVQCNYFVKNKKNNWSVTLHRDLSIPVKEKTISKDWKCWSKKEGILYAQPPKRVLTQMIAIRLHLEDNNSENGALELVAGSHRNFNLDSDRSLSFVTQGGVLAMRPLTLHASTKLKSGKRRVLHFVFGPRKLPNGVEWANVL